MRLDGAETDFTGSAIWIDVEDVFDYFRFNPHPSGIQRVALDIMAALTVAAPGRVRFGRHAGVGEWREVIWSDVEAIVAAPAIEAEVEEVDDDQARRSRVQRVVHRLPAEVRDPLLRTGVLQGQVVRNVRALLELVRPPAPVTLRALPAGAAPVAGAGPGRGDLVVVLGAPWSVRGAAARMAALRADGVRIAVLIHDLIPVRRPEWFPANRVERFRAWLHAALRHADWVLTISRFTAGDVAAYAAREGIAIEAPLVLQAGASRLPAGDGVPAGLPVAGRYVLFVSTLEARKNHALVVQVWQRLMAEVRAGVRAAETVPQLVFAGRVGTGVADLLQQLDNSRWLGGRIRLLREPGDAEIRALYEGCLFSVLPSLFEGWGLPLGESLALGKPCLAARGTALEEAGAICAGISTRRMSAMPIGGDGAVGYAGGDRGLGGGRSGAVSGGELGRGGGDDRGAGGMTIWFDVEDMVTYFRSGNRRISGIQRLSFEIFRAAKALEDRGWRSGSCGTGRGRRR